MKLKRVTIKHVVPEDSIGCKTTVRDDDYIGHGHMLLRSDIAPERFKAAIEALPEIRILKMSDTLWDFTNHKCSDAVATTSISEDKKIIWLYTDIGDVVIDYNYYCYVKKLKLELRFEYPLGVIGLFKSTPEKDMFGKIIDKIDPAAPLVGILMPLKP